MSKSPQAIDWQSSQEQQDWFEQFKNKTGSEDGIDFDRFRAFLDASLYSYLTEAIASLQKSQSQPVSCERIKFSLDQELQLFKHFDSRNDELIDRDEFALVCQNWLHQIYRARSALVVVDVQNDFIDGSLALIKSPAGQDGAEVVPIINDLLSASVFDTIVYTQDWHPSDHIGFHDNLHLRKYTLKADATTKNQQANHEDAFNSDDKELTGGATDSNNSATFCKVKKLSTRAKVFDSVLFDDGRMEQVLWPRHCVQQSWGAELHPDLKVVPNSIRILKGTLSHVDAYSAFWDNMRLNETSLRDELSSRGVTDVFCCGLAYDYCVAASAMDSRKAGFMTYVIEDACRGINKLSIEQRSKEMICNNILIVNTATTCSYLATTRHFLQINENSQVTHNGHGCNRKIQIKIDNEPMIGSNNNIGSCHKLARSDNIRDMLITVCFKKAFVKVSDR